MVDALSATRARERQVDFEEAVEKQLMVLIDCVFFGDLLRRTVDSCLAILADGIASCADDVILCSRSCA